jgi:hypothetical protein
MKDEGKDKGKYEGHRTEMKVKAEVRFSAERAGAGDVAPFQQALVVKPGMGDIEDGRWKMEDGRWKMEDGR